MWEPKNRALGEPSGHLTTPLEDEALWHLLAHSPANRLGESGNKHLGVQIVALSSTFADAAKHGYTRVCLGDVIDQLHDEHGLSNANATK